MQTKLVEYYKEYNYCVLMYIMISFKTMILTYLDTITPSTAPPPRVCSYNVYTWGKHGHVTKRASAAVTWNSLHDVYLSTLSVVPRLSVHLLWRDLRSDVTHFSCRGHCGIW